MRQPCTLHWKMYFSSASVNEIACKGYMQFTTAFKPVPSLFSFKMAFTIFHPLQSSIIDCNFGLIYTKQHIICNWVKVWNWFAQWDFSKHKQQICWLDLRMWRWTRRMSLCISCGFCFLIDFEIDCFGKIAFFNGPISINFRKMEARRAGFFFFSTFSLSYWPLFQVSNGNVYKNVFFFVRLPTVAFGVSFYSLFISVSVVRVEMIFRSTRLTRCESNMDRTFNWPLLDWMCMAAIYYTVTNSPFCSPLSELIHEKIAFILYEVIICGIVIIH